MAWPWWPCPKTGTTYSTYNPNFDWIRLLWFNQGLPMSFLKAARPNFVISSFGSSFTRKIRRKQNTTPQKHEILPDSKMETKNMWFWLKPRYTSAMPTQLILPNTQMFFSPAPVPWRPPLLFWVVLGSENRIDNPTSNHKVPRTCSAYSGPCFKKIPSGYKSWVPNHMHHNCLHKKKQINHDKSFSTIVGFHFSLFLRKTVYRFLMYHQHKHHRFFPPCPEWLGWTSAAMQQCTSWTNCENTIHTQMLHGAGICTYKTHWFWG